MCDSLIYLRMNASNCRLSFSKRAKISRLYVQTRRSFTSGDANSFDSHKMQQMNAKILPSTKWKTYKQLRQYLNNLSQNDLLSNALNKEIAHLMQKFQPKVYGNHLVRFFAQPSVVMDETKSQKVDVKTKEQSGSLSLPDFIGTLRIRIGSKDEAKAKVMPKWHIKSTAPKEAISSRLTYLLACIKNSSDEQDRLSKINEFCDHLKTYSDAKNLAFREGAVTSLLKLRFKKNINEEVKGALNEALSLLGYSFPVRGAGLRILSIDGGGTRGLLAIQMLKKLEEMTGRPIVEMFDMICGVSTGAIIAGLLVIQKKSLAEIEEIYEKIGRVVFTQHPLKGTGSLVWSHSYYDTSLWESLLKAEVGKETMISSQRKPNTSKLLIVSAVVNQSRLSAYVFRNYNLPCKVQSQYFGSSSHQVWEAVRASAAAPTYFEEFRVGNSLHQDGGILVNNPTAVAIHEAKLLWPHTPLQCVISCGTGRTAPNPIDPDVVPESLEASSWKNKFLAVIDSATDTEGVHSMLSDLLPPKTYYRFNPYLTEMLSISEISPEKMDQLKRDAIMYLRRNEEKFQEAADTLKIEKGPMQRLSDFVSMQLQVNGLFSSKY